MSSESLRFEGIGLHTGADCRMDIERFETASKNYPITFVTTQVEIPAHVNYAVDLPFRTVLERGAARVETVEHLLAALTISGITHARIMVDGPEIPIMDGSALPFVEAFINAGWVDQEEGRPIEPSLSKALTVESDSGFIRFEPVEEPFTTCTFTHLHPLIGEHTITTERKFSWWLENIVPARTFGFRKAEESLRAMGLIRGVSLDNCIVFNDDGVENSEGLRFADEPARHKLLDLVGDLVLAGRPIAGRITAQQPGHQLNHRLARKIADSIDE